MEMAQPAMLTRNAMSTDRQDAPDAGIVEYLPIVGSFAQLDKLIENAAAVLLGLLPPADPFPRYIAVVNVVVPNDVVWLFQFPYDLTLSQFPNQVFAAEFNLIHEAPLSVQIRGPGEQPGRTPENVQKIVTRCHAQILDFRSSLQTKLFQYERTEAKEDHGADSRPHVVSAGQDHACSFERD
jgi:hypothetical protein